MDLEVVDVSTRPGVDTLDRDRVQAYFFEERRVNLGRHSEKALVAGRLELHGRLNDIIVNFDLHFRRDELLAVTLLGLQSVAKDECAGVALHCNVVPGDGGRPRDLLTLSVHSARESGEVDQMAVTGPAKRIAADSWRSHAIAATCDLGIADVEPLDAFRKLRLRFDRKVVDADDVAAAAGVGKHGGITAQLDLVVALIQVDLDCLGHLAE